MRPLLLLASLLPFQALAEPLDQCPTEAFLFQQSQTKVFGVDLFTGATSELAASTGLSGTINAVGFNEADRYIYGFHKESLQVVRVDRNFQAQTLTISGLPDNTHFFVGDVKDNIYWLYRQNVGLYAIDLSQQPLQAQKIQGADVSMSLTDFAFHPSDGYLYAVGNNNGFLYRIDVSSGSKTKVAEIGETGTFGAAYFEKSGYFYVSRNADGNIFRIDVRDPANIPNGSEIFAFGPSSSQNDGARCANAPIVPTNTDFGDAPDSYGTTIEANGARHGQVDSLLRLGALVDIDSDGAPSAADGDDSNGQDDEDGVEIKGVITAGLDTIVQVEVSGQGGYLQGFFDWNSNGTFTDDGEQVFVDHYLDIGSHRLLVRGPQGLTAGSSYARFRLSSQAGLGSTGGAADGEVEDHPIELAHSSLSYTYYPSAGGWAMLAFEDFWPSQADYDMNDLVMAVRVTEVRSANQLIRIDLAGQLVAAGASFRNGFGWHLSDIANDSAIPASAINRELIRHRVNGIDVSTEGVLEAERIDAIIQVFSNNHDLVTHNCNFYRTEQGCNHDLQYQFEISIPMLNGLDNTAVPDIPYNPFLFATPNTYRDNFDVHPGRSLEIHLADYPPTEAANSQYFGNRDDRTQIGGSTYRNDNNLPWALLIPDVWQHPKETVDLLQAYPNFADYVQSDGTTDQDWFKAVNGINSNIYQGGQ